MNFDGTVFPSTLHRTMTYRGNDFSILSYAMQPGTVLYVKSMVQVEQENKAEFWCAVFRL